MLFHENLEEIIFGRHNLIESDELLIISGYLGPNPILRLNTLPFKSTVIYGMYGAEGIRNRLHNTLTSINNSNQNINIRYSNTPVHSKCYIWKKENRIVHALVGSANFSSNGLNTPYREILAETTIDTFMPLNNYANIVLGNTIDCVVGVASEGRQSPSFTRIQAQTRVRETNSCQMTLLDPRTNEVQNTNGLNWGQNPANHTNPNDANIPIRTEYIRLYPELFPQKRTLPANTVIRRGSARNNDAIDIIWDDGENMRGMLEGTQPFMGATYPKQISSFPEKSTLGTYIRQRIGVANGTRVTRRHLERYGRTNIDISLQSDGVYFFDFST